MIQSWKDCAQNRLGCPWPRCFGEIDVHNITHNCCFNLRWYASLFNIGEGSEFWRKEERRRKKERRVKGKADLGFSLSVSFFLSFLSFPSPPFFPLFLSCLYLPVSLCWIGIHYVLSYHAMRLGASSCLCLSASSIFHDKQWLGYSEGGEADGQDKAHGMTSREAGLGLGLGLWWIRLGLG